MGFIGPTKVVPFYKQACYQVFPQRVKSYPFKALVDIEMPQCRPWTKAISRNSSSKTANATTQARSRRRGRGFAGRNFV